LLECNNQSNCTEHRTLTDPSVSTIDNDLNRREKKNRRNKQVSLLAQDQFLAQNVRHFSKREGNSNGESFWNEGNYLNMGLSKGRRSTAKEMRQTHDRDNIDQENRNSKCSRERTTKPVT
jgi:hypothetical protein